MGKTIAIMVGALALTPAAHATESGPRRTLPAQFTQFLSPAQLQSTAPATTPAQLNVLKRFEEDDLRITGYVASRSGTDVPDYRLYVGVRYQSMLGSLAKITSRAFYGSGTYDGINTTGVAAPEDVRMNGALAGNWLGVDWNADVALARDLALKVRMRYADRADAITPRTPRVELIYRPAQAASVSAIFDQTSGLEVGMERGVFGDTRGRGELLLAGRCLSRRHFIGWDHNHSGLGSPVRHWLRQARRSDEPRSTDSAEAAVLVIRASVHRPDECDRG